MTMGVWRKKEREKNIKNVHTSFEVMNKSKERQGWLFIALDIRKLRSRVKRHQLATQNSSSLFVNGKSHFIVAFFVFIVRDGD